MRKVYLNVLLILLTGGLVFGGLVQPGMAEDKPKYGGKLILNFFRPVSRIGVPLNVRHSDQWYANHAIDKLIQSSEEVAGAVVPQLAINWELAPDKLSYTFKLRKGVKFHDGTDFNAQAVKWNLDKVIVASRPQLSKLTSIEVIDDYTVKFNLSSWDNQILNEFNSDVGLIISPASFEKNGEEWANVNPIGTGAWVKDKLRRNTMISYKKNENYWEKGVPYMDELVYYHIPDAMTASAAFKKGELDILYSTDSITASELQAVGKYIVQTNPGPSTGIVMNTKDPNSIWYDKRMRYALEYAINKEELTRVVGRGFSRPSYEIVKAIYEAGGKPGTTLREYNPEKARQLMREAGYPDGVKVKWTVNADGGQDGNVALLGYFAEVGINIEFVKVRGATLNQMSFEPPLGSDLRSEAQRGGAANPLGGVKNALSETSIYFPGLKRPDGFQELVEKALLIEDAKEVMPYLEKMEKLAYDFAMFVPVQRGVFCHIIQPYVKNPRVIYAGGPRQKLQYTWVER
ncbi:ABC transporter substrate-binding protein [Thermodesulfobacteriota bacterium]